MTIAQGLILNDDSIQIVYEKTILFAAEKHSRQNQLLPDTNIPYVVHLSNVCMEIFFASLETEPFNFRYAMQLSLLHDVLEDTDTDENELETKFGHTILDGVKALTKNKQLAKAEQIIDSINRIKSMPKEVWAVKLADRISNLQRSPTSWSKLKVEEYRRTSEIIYEELGSGNIFLAKILKERILTYM